MVKDGDEEEQIAWAYNAPYNIYIHDSCCPGAEDGLQVLLGKERYRFQALRQGRGRVRKVRLVRTITLPYAEYKASEELATFPSIAQLSFCHHCKSLVGLRPWR